MDRNNIMTAGEVRRVTGVSRPRLRHWERIGIITPTIEQHLSRQWHVYTLAEVDRIKAIMALINEGWTLRGAAAKVGDPKTA